MKYIIVQIQFLINVFKKKSCLYFITQIPGNCREKYQKLLDRKISWLRFLRCCEVSQIKRQEYQKQEKQTKKLTQTEKLLKQLKQSTNSYNVVLRRSFGLQKTTKHSPQRIIFSRNKSLDRRSKNNQYIFKGKIKQTPRSSKRKRLKTSLIQNQRSEKNKRHSKKPKRPFSSKRKSKRGINTSDFNDRNFIQLLRSKVFGQQDTLKQLFLGTTENLKALARSQKRKTKQSQPRWQLPVRTRKQLERQSKKRKKFTLIKKQRTYDNVIKRKLIKDKFIKPKRKLQKKQNKNLVQFITSVSQNKMPGVKRSKKASSIKKNISKKQGKDLKGNTNFFNNKKVLSKNKYELKIKQQKEKIVNLNPSDYYMNDLEQACLEPNDSDYYNVLRREHFSQTIQSLAFARDLPDITTKQLKEKSILLKKAEEHENRKTVVFDLDETLIHCNESLDIPSDAILPISFPSGEVTNAGINVRPYAKEILKEMAKLFEVVVFTASHQCYADVVLDYLDPNHQLIHHRLFRENCVQTEEGIFIKDLRIFKGRNLKDIVLIDNACYSFGYQIENGVPIIPYYDNKEDRELLNLQHYLKNLVNNDIREINSATFKFHLYTDFEPPVIILEKLFNFEMVEDQEEYETLHEQTPIINMKQLQEEKQQDRTKQLPSTSKNMEQNIDTSENLCTEVIHEDKINPGIQQQQQNVDKEEQEEEEEEESIPSFMNKKLQFQFDEEDNEKQALEGNKQMIKQWKDFLEDANFKN